MALPWMNSYYHNTHRNRNMGEEAKVAKVSTFVLNASLPAPALL